MKKIYEYSRQELLDLDDLNTWSITDDCDYVCGSIDEEDYEFAYSSNDQHLHQKGNKWCYINFYEDYIMTFSYTDEYFKQLAIDLAASDMPAAEIISIIDTKLEYASRSYDNDNSRITQKTSDDLDNLRCEMLTHVMVA